ncbi:Olfactory receptor 5M11 [Camelus dromedarius]|uniref:Olfactory receptor 5M11 n=1 Tax=Camelus dromedarius TaxID=9838 RepID=A0A5N4DPD4_CAMDR|nr:Olfactory receptor 5M11 [Camelus dromedarius]
MYFFPDPLVLRGSVLLFQCDSKDAGDLLIREENHLLFCLSGAVLLLYCPVLGEIDSLLYGLGSVQAQAQRLPITNDSVITQFILLGLMDCPELQPLLFVLYLVVYLVTLLGNLGMVLVIRLDPRLHTPMYFFLTNLAFVDLCSTLNATPQMLTKPVAERPTTLAGCLAQCYLFIALLLTSTDFLLAAAMAYTAKCPISISPCTTL